MTPGIAQLDRRSRRLGQIAPLHVVQLSRDPERLRATWVDLWVTTARGRVRAR